MKALQCVLFGVILFVACANCWISRYHPYPYYPPAKRQIYGTVDGFERIGYRHERRYGFPFFTREGEVIFPSVCNYPHSSVFSSLNFKCSQCLRTICQEYTTNSPYDFNYFIRGIVHENLIDDEDCIPVLDIIEGGIFDRNVTIKIHSQRSCGIDSKVSIYGDKAWRN